MLSGEGADEILAGYWHIYKRECSPSDAAYEQFPRLTPWVARKLALMFPRTGRPAFTRGWAELYRWSSDTAECRWECLPGTSGANFSDDRAVKLPPGPRQFRSCFDAVPKKDVLNRMLYADAKIWLPDDLLLKADKMTMANSLELRVPFLDHKLVEFAAILPTELKLKGSTGKYLLREAMKNVLPKQIINRSQRKGFPCQR